MKFELDKNFAEQFMSLSLDSAGQEPLRLDNHEVIQLENAQKPIHPVLKSQFTPK